ncbi:MAG: hypothetical protein M0Z54_15765 [Thermaerobacter sp.]|nr:hypothetical protein [Thermaerobacter sp.]
MTPLQQTMRDELLHQFPAWQDPVRILEPRRRPRVRGPWLLPAALAVAALLMLVPSILKPAAVTTLAPRVERLAWPTGFTAASGLSLGQGRLVMFSGRRVRSYIAGRLGHLAWALGLPQNTRVLTAAGGAYGGAAVVVQQPGDVNLLVVNARGRIVGQHRLWPPLQKTRVPASAPRAVTLRAAAAGWWVASDRASTWIVNDARAGGAGVVGPLAGGSGALALASGAQGDPWNVAAWSPTTAHLNLYTREGRRLESVADPAAGRLLHFGGQLAPTVGGVGFVITAGSQGGPTMPVSAWFPGTSRTTLSGLATPAGLVSDARAGLALLPWGEALSARWAFAGVHLAPMGFMSPAGAVLGIARGQVEVVRWDGSMLARAAVGRVTARQVGGHFSYLATRRGLVQLGPFPTPAALTRAVVWRGSFPGGTVTGRVHGVRQGARVTEPPSPVSQPLGFHFVNPIWDGPFQPLGAELHIVGAPAGETPAELQYAFATDAAGMLNTGWGPPFRVGPASPAAGSRLTTALSPVDRVSQVQWEGIQAGWQPGTRTLVLTLDYAPSPAVVPRTVTVRLQRTAG